MPIIIDWVAVDEMLKKGYEGKQIAKFYGFCEDTLYLAVKREKGVSFSVYRAKQRASIELVNVKQNKKNLPKEKRSQKGAGYVYLIHCETTRYYKIGMSKINLASRLSCMQSGCPFILTPIHCEYTANPYETEKMLHNKFHKKRVMGEWFEFDKEDVDFIVSEIQKAATDQYELFLRKK